MNPTVYGLLKRYLARSVWLYAFLGLLQFMLTGVYWVEGYDRVPTAGVLLGIWGAVAALNTHSLVWRRGMPACFGGGRWRAPQGFFFRS
jgi:hypothetical protein